MTKNCYIQLFRAGTGPCRIFKPGLAIRLVACLLFIMPASASVTSVSYADATPLTLNVTDKSVAEILEAIEAQSDYSFFYNNRQIDADRKVSVRAENKDVFAILDMVFSNSNVTYKVIDRDVILTVSPDAAQSPRPQQNVVTGRVTDESGTAIIGATVLVKGTQTATYTDAAGDFSITVPDGDVVLTVNFLGYLTREVAIGTQRTLTVVLQPDIQHMAEVVVLGYGSVSKRELTSAVVSVQSRDFIQGAFSNPLSMITGKVAGVNIANPNSGNPNADPSVQMRGASSIRAGNDPLIIIDGMPGGNLRSVANQDIESMTILKDGSAAAIYGSRAANGVILIETKKGKAGRVSVSYEGYLDHDMLAPLPDVLSAEEFLRRERDIDFGSRNDWYDLLLNRGNIGQSHHVAVSGGGENLVFRASANYKTKEGMAITNFRKEYGARMGFNAKAFNNRLELTGNMSTRVVNQTDASMSVFNQATKLNPTQPLMERDDPGKYSILYGQDVYNPVGWLRDMTDGYDRQYTTIDFRAKLNILDNLNTEASFARQSHESLRKTFYNSDHKDSADNMRKGMATLRDDNSTSYTFEWIGNYFADFGRHSVKLMAGYSYQEYNDRYFWAQNGNFPSDGLTFNALQSGDWMSAAGRLGMESGRSKEKTIGFPARLTYDYDDTWFLTASVRYEGNTKFGENNKWGWFPAASAAWRFSNLGIFRDSKVVDDLKLRVSYGVTGRSGFDRYTAMARYSGTSSYPNDSGQYIQAWGPANNPNPDLRWEKQVSYNLGVDFVLFGNKLSGSLDAFLRQGQDVIAEYDAPQPPSIYGTIITNVASTKSKGLEFTLNWNVVNRSDFTYNTTLVASNTKSVLHKFSNDIYQKGYMDMYGLPSPGNPGYAQRLQDGSEIGTFFGHKYAGVDGDGNILIWKDAIEGGEKILASANAGDPDKAALGHGTPRWSISWGNTLTYKGFDLSLYFMGQFNYKILNMYQMYYGLTAEPGINLLKDAYGKNAHIKSAKVVCDYFLEPGDWFSLENVTLGWTPRLKSNVIGNLRVYATARNVFTLTKYSVLSPKSVNTNGLTPGVSGLDIYPVISSVVFGVQLSF